MASADKDPQATLNYGWDWTDWLGSDVIVASTWIVSSGLTLVNQSFTDKTTAVMVSGGASGQSYDLVNHIITAQGLEDERTISLKAIDR